LAHSARIKELSAAIEFATNSPLLTFLIRRFLQVLEQPIDDAPAETTRAQLVPRFTIRTLLAMITLCAIIFVMIGTATRGQYWAWGMTIGLVSAIIAALAHAAWFGIVWMFMRMWRLETKQPESTWHTGSWHAPNAADVSSKMQSPHAGQAQP
jgi:hypothetical protein